MADEAPKLPPRRRRGWHRRKGPSTPSIGFPGRPPRPLDVDQQDPAKAGWSWEALGCWTKEAFYRGAKRLNGLALEMIRACRRRGGR